jgi:Kef-type K+ transport system membrane component KefB
MRKVALYSLLLVAGLAASQVLPQLLGPAHAGFALVVRLLTMTALAFIMIHVGREFEIEKGKLDGYGKDYLVAMTAAAFPWIFVTGYFLLFVLPPGSLQDGRAWIEALLAGRFAAPTSAGVLFSMLAAAGLGATWMFRKARVLAIFDDLDTVLLMIPLKMLMVGLAWQLGVVVLVMAALLWAGWKWLHRVPMPTTWGWTLGYSAALMLVCEAVYQGSKAVQADVPVHIEVLLPAFVLGCITKRQPAAEHGPGEARASTLISAVFMVLVGLSMPALFGASDAAVGDGPTAAQPELPWSTVLFHVLAVSVLANLGKMFPLFVYRDEASWRERLAVCVAMWPRGEVGAGVLILALGYGIGGPVVTVAVLSLALNLALSGLFILAVRRLLEPAPAASPVPVLKESTT